MAFFDATQLALAKGLSVFYGELYDIYLKSGIELHYWDGFGDLVIAGDLIWDAPYTGAANVVARDDIPMGIDDDAGQLNLTMSGVDADVVAAVRGTESDFYGAPIMIRGQFFDEDLQPSGDSFFLFRGTMDVPTYRAQGPTQRSITIPCEGEWVDRNRAAFSNFSDIDQKARFASDRGCEYVYRYTIGVRRHWPFF